MRDLVACRVRNLARLPDVHRDDSRDEHPNREVAVLHNRPPRQLENTNHGGTLRASVVRDQNVMRKPSCIILP